MKAPNRIQTLSTNLCLLILALGFATLGLVSLINKQSDCTSIISAEHTYSLVGSTFSLLVGATFLVAAITFKGFGTFGNSKALNLSARGF
jgi:hypothetical protein